MMEEVVEEVIEEEVGEMEDEGVMVGEIEDEEEFFLVLMVLVG